MKMTGLRSLFFSLLIMLVIQYPVKANSAKRIDSLTHLLNTLPASQQRLTILNELSWETSRSQPQKSKEYAEEAYTLSKRLGNRKEEATSLNRLGELLRIADRFDSATYYFENALIIERAIDHQYGIARAQAQLASTYIYTGRYKAAEIAAKESLAIFEQMNNPVNIINAYQRLAYVYDKIGRPAKAIEFYKKELNFMVERDIHYSKAMLFSGLGQAYLKLGSLDLAYDYVEQARQTWQSNKDGRRMAECYKTLAQVFIAKGEYSFAENATLQSMHILDSLDLGHLNSENYNNLGVIAERNGEPEKARNYYLSSLEYNLASGNKANLAQTYFNLANTSQYLGETQSALNHYESAIELGTASNSLLLNAYWAISDIYYQEEKYELANRYKEAYRAMQTKIEETKNDALVAKDQFELEQKRTELLARDNKIKSEQLQKLIFLLIAAVLFGLAAIVGFFFLRIKKNIKIQEQQMELKEIGARLAGQDKERARIAKDLHDKLGMLFSLIKGNFETMRSQFTDVKTDQNFGFNRISDLIEEAQNGIREISHGMISVVLYKFGLKKALENLAESIAGSTTIEVHYHTHKIEAYQMDYDFEVSIYRIILELTNNVIKHAEATELTIQLISRKDQFLHIEVHDNGKGYDQRVATSGGIGLKNIRGRVQALEGKIRIDTGKGVGTFVEINVPIKLNEDDKGNAGG